MTLGSCKKRIDSILARRMIMESKEHFGGSRESAAWKDRLCSWCGAEYNPLAEKHKAAGCNKECCSAACIENKAMTANNVSARLKEIQRQRQSKKAERERISRPERELLRKLVQSGGKEWTTKQASDLSGNWAPTSIKTTYKQLVGMEIVGVVERQERRIRNRDSFVWRLCECKEVEQARKWLENR